MSTPVGRARRLKPIDTSHPDFQRVIPQSVPTRLGYTLERKFPDTSYIMSPPDNAPSRCQPPDCDRTFPLTFTHTDARRRELRSNARISANASHAESLALRAQEDGARASARDAARLHASSNRITAYQDMLEHTATVHAKATDTRRSRRAAPTQPQPADSGVIAAHRSPGYNTPPYVHPYAKIKAEAEMAAAAAAGSSRASDGDARAALPSVGAHSAIASSRGSVVRTSDGAAGGVDA